MWQNLRDQLDDDGYCVCRGLLTKSLIRDMHALSAGILAVLAADHRARNRSQGSLVPMADHPGYTPIIAADELAAAFRGLGFGDPRFSSGYLISKPPGGPPLFWHQDWWGWDDPVSYGPEIAQVFVMVYLSDTTIHNGCLRVIEGTHRRRHALHDAKAAHGEALSRVDDPNDPLFGAIQDEVAVPVQSGDVIIGDARLLHAAHANQSGQERSLLTLWFHPNAGSLPAGMQARIRAIFDREGVDTDMPDVNPLTLDGWPHKDRIAHYFPDKLAARPHEWNRVPDVTQMAN